MMGALLPGVKRHCMGRQLTIQIERAIDAMQPTAMQDTSPNPCLLVWGQPRERPRGSRGPVGDLSIKHVA